jgi:hypothetical protein
MGCDYDCFLVKSDTVKSFNYEGWFTENRPVFPQVDDHDADSWVPYFGDGSLLWNLFDYCQLPKLRETNNDAWIVVEINKENIEVLLSSCKKLIDLSLDIETDEDFKNSVFSNMFRWWCVETPEDLCAIFRNLRYTKNILKDHPDYSMVININY